MNAVKVGDGISHSVRVVMITPEGKILLVHQKKRIGPPKTDGRPGYPRPESYGIPGGTREQGEHLIGTPEKEGTAMREARGEAQRVVPYESFKEEYALHFPPRPSDRPGAKEVQTHYYFVLLTEEMEMVPEIAESEKDEIIGQEFFSFDKFPLPDDRIPSFRSHIRSLHTLLKHLEDKVEDARDWRYALEKRAGEYIF